MVVMLGMNSLAKRIELASEGMKRGWQASLARYCSVRPPSVSDWVSGKTKELDGENLLKASEFFGVLPMWMATGKGLMRSKDKLLVKIDEQSDYTAIKRVKFKLSAGVSGYEVEYLNGHRAPTSFRQDWLKARHLKADNLFAVEVSGQSMETSLCDGDLVVVNTADVKPSDGDVFAANYEGELVVKRMVRNGGEWLLSSDNTDKRRFSDKRCDERTSIIGRVVYKQSERI